LNLKNRFDFKSIRFKLWIYFIGFAMLLIGLIWFLQIFFLNNYYDHMKTGEITKIAKAIEDIAFQTNILSINASVEAARAGMAGKGFAVVADEGRNLAFKSDQAAKATQQLIENSVQAAERGSGVADEVSKTLQRSLDLVVQSSNEIGQIAEAVQGEAETISQVTEGISQISAVVQTNSASSEESAAVSAELFDQVRLLQDQTRRFRLKQ